MKTHYRLVLSVALIGMALLMRDAEAKPRSKVVRISLAGSRLDIGQADFVKFDSKANYYLIHGGDNWESPGAYLLLCPAADLSSLGTFELVKGEVQRTTLPRLRTGRGINIGDTPAQVRQKIGASPRH